MVEVKLRPFLRPNLDVAFVALNPPEESNENGHYFSGRNSRFFHLLHISGLITRNVTKLMADGIVFGGTSINHKHAAFGVVDLIEDRVETSSSHVQAREKDVDLLIARIHQLKPRFACVIHSKVRDALKRHRDFKGPLEYGICGRLLSQSQTVFVLNYFPNGNNIPDEKKLEIFGALRDAL